MIWDIVSTATGNTLQGAPPIDVDTEEEARQIALAVVGFKVIAHVCRSASCRISHGAIVDRGEPGGGYGEDEPPEDDGDEFRGGEAAAYDRDQAHAIQRDLKR